MTVDAESHGEPVNFVQQRHLIDLTVTFGTAHALGDVDGVIEIHIVW